MGSFPWYSNGLQFKCTGCGKCCTGPKGRVWVLNDEVVQMAEILQLSLQQFKIKYLRHRENKWALIEKKNGLGEYDCIFLKDNKCSIYDARPQQCRTYPWWQENLNTPESWKLAAEMCEGITLSAPTVPYSEITKNLP